SASNTCGWIGSIATKWTISQRQFGCGIFSARTCDESEPATQIESSQSAYVYTWTRHETAPRCLREIQAGARSTLAGTGRGHEREPGQHGDLPRRRTALSLRCCAERVPLALQSAGPDSRAVGCAHGRTARN